MINRNIGNSLLLVISVTISFFISSCSNEPTNKSKSKLLEINRFTLDQTNEIGQKIFQVSSEKALIDDSSKQMLTLNTNILLYDQSQETYSIKSDQAKIENNGESFSLIGNVTLTKVNDPNFNVLSDRVEWKPSDELLLFFGNVKGEINYALIYSERAIYDLNKHSLDFQGIKQFNVNSPSYLQPVFDVNANSAVWSGDTGVFEFFSDSGDVTSKILLKQ